MMGAMSTPSAPTAPPPAGGVVHPGAAWWRVGRWFLGVLLVGVVVVELVEGRDDLARAVDAVSDPRWGPLLLAVVVDLASMVAYAVMQRRLLLGAGAPASGAGRRAVTSLAFTAHSLSITLPGGPVFSTALNFRRMTAMGASGPAASWVIAVSGFLSAASLAGLGAVAGLATGARGDGTHLLVAVGVALVVLVAARVVRRQPAVVARRRALRRRAAAGLAQLRVRRPRVGAAAGALHSLAARLASVRVGPATWAWAGGGALLNWMLDALALALVCRAVGLDDLSALHLLLAYTAAMAAASFPVVPAGLGVVDAALVVGLVAAGATTGEALAADVLYRVVSLGVVGGTGWALWGAHRVRERRGAAGAGGPTREALGSVAGED